MNVAYLFTFFLVLLLALFVLLPFLRQGKNSSPSSSRTSIPESEWLEEEDMERDRDRIDVIDVEESPSSSASLASAEIEIEVAVAKARRAKSTFWNCVKCGRRMQDADQFCASCGSARQSS